MLSPPTERPNDDMPRIRVRVKEVVMPENSIDRTVSRRTVLKAAAATGLALSTHGLLELLAQPTMRLAMAAPATLPDIQFDIRAFVPPAQTVDGVVVRFGPVFTRFVTLKLTRTPDLADQQRLVAALAAIEGRYPFRDRKSVV